MNRAQLHTKADELMLRLHSHFKRVLESAELNSTCDETQNFILDTSVQSIVSTSAELIEFVGELKLLAILNETQPQAPPPSTNKAQLAWAAQLEAYVNKGSSNLN
jgi:chemotaxis regulatin CheY-phosphate phosphatase CheZ